MENGISSGNGKETISRTGNIHTPISLDNLFTESHTSLFTRKKSYLSKSSTIQIKVVLIEQKIV